MHRKHYETGLYETTGSNLVPISYVSY